MSTILQFECQSQTASQQNRDCPVPPGPVGESGTGMEPIRYVASEEFTAAGQQEVERAAELLRQRSAAVRSSKPGKRVAYLLPPTIVQLCESPLLSPEEEVQLFRSMNYLKYQAELMRESLEEGEAEPKHIAQLDQLLAAACEIRNAIVEANTRLVVSVVKPFADGLNSFEDLVSEGITAVLRATETYDYGRGFRFSTYATRSIRSALYRKIMRDRKRRERFRSGAIEGPGEPWQETDSDQLTNHQYRELRDVVGNMLETLDERERLIIEARYQFTGQGKRPPFRVLAERLGVSKERVRQLEARALTKLAEVCDQLPRDLLAHCQ